MTDFSLLLGINSETLRSLISAYSGYAAYLEADDNSEMQKIAACYLYAAAYEVLLDQVKALEWFAVAAERYTQAGDPYGVIASLCCKEVTYLGYADYMARRNTSPDMQFYQLLNLSFIGEAVKTSASKEPVGRLKIPFHLYADAIEATTDLSWEQQPEQLPEAWKPLLYGINEKVLLLRQDTLRWQQLKGTVIPIAPEAIAACITLLAITERNDIPRNDIAALIQQQESPIFIPMKIALEI